jgi:serine protease Do
VRVNIIRTITDAGPGETVTINGQKITNYHPKIIRMFPSTGIVIDDKRHVLTFLGYRWIDVQGEPRRIDIVTSRGERFPAKMVGIDQNSGVAVLRCEGAPLELTPLCLRCEIRDGATVVAPLPEGLGPNQFLSAQIVSVGSAGEAAQGGWVVRVNRELPGIGEPLLDERFRVLGFIANQKPSVQDPAGMQTIVYPIAHLLASAQKILNIGGDIHTGWLGVYLDDSAPPSSSGVAIKSLLRGSPASKAGLAPQDVLTKWDGTRIQDARQFIRLVQETRPGTKVNLEILRKGRPMSLAPVIETRRQDETPGTFILNFPEEITPDGISFRTVPQPRPGLGVVILPLTPQLAEYLKVSARVGLLVSDVTPQMPAARAGVQVGDIILAFDGQRTVDPQEFSTYIQERDWGSTVALKLLRRGEEQNIQVTLPMSPQSPKKP